MRSTSALTLTLVLASSGCANVLDLDRGSDMLDDDAGGANQGDSAVILLADGGRAAVDSDAGVAAVVDAAPESDAPEPKCLPEHAACADDSQCCSGSCGPGKGGCRR